MSNKIALHIQPLRLLDDATLEEFGDVAEFELFSVEVKVDSDIEDVRLRREPPIYRVRRQVMQAECAQIRKEDEPPFEILPSEYLRCYLTCKQDGQRVDRVFTFNVTVSQVQQWEPRDEWEEVTFHRGDDSVQFLKKASARRRIIERRVFVLQSIGEPFF